MTKQYDYASFYPGQPFPYEQAETPSDYLETALAAERYIASRQLEDADGVYWQEDGQSAYDISLFKGASGIAFFYLELHKATGEQRFADIARSAVLRISRFWRNAADKPVILFPGDIRFGLQLGVPGEGSILALAYKAFKEPEIERALRDIVAFLAENAKRDDEGGAYWNDNGLPISDGGAVLFLARFLEISDDADAKKLAVDAGEHILRSGREVGAGLSFDKSEPPAGDFGPNLETGTAGVAFVLEHVYRLTGDKKYLEAAEKAVTYLKTLLVPQEKGHLLPVRIEHDEPISKATRTSTPRWATMIQTMASCRATTPNRSAIWANAAARSAPDASTIRLPRIPGTTRTST